MPRAIPGKRYYGGCEFVDEAETLAIDRREAALRRRLRQRPAAFRRQANQAVPRLLQPGDRIMGMNLAAGGHLTHGSPVTMSGKWFDVVSYEAARGPADRHGRRGERPGDKPKLIIAGASAYPRQIDFARFRAIADEVGACLMVDMAHYAGLVAAGLHPNPVPHAHVTHHHHPQDPARPPRRHHPSPTTRTAKKPSTPPSSRAPGRPLMHVIAAKVPSPSARRCSRPSRTTPDRHRQRPHPRATLQKGGLDIVSGGN